MTHERLRQARELRGWGIDELARRSGTRAHLLLAIERGSFDQLPSGLYGRAAIRSYAAAVGLNPDAVIAEVQPLLPVYEDPLDGLARRYGHARKQDKADSTPAEPAATVAAALPLHTMTASAGHEPADIVLAGVEREPTVDAAAPAGDAAPARGSLRAWWRPAAAAWIDGSVLAALGVALVWLTALACAAPVTVTLRVAAPGIAVVFALIVALYLRALQRPRERHAWRRRDGPRPRPVRADRPQRAGGVRTRAALGLPRLGAARLITSAGTR